MNTIADTAQIRAFVYVSRTTLTNFSHVSCKVAHDTSKVIGHTIHLVWHNTLMPGLLSPIATFKSRKIASLFGEHLISLVISWIMLKASSITLDFQMVSLAVKLRAWPNNA